MEDKDTNRQFYISVWRHVLVGFLKWPEDAFSEFVRLHEPGFEDRAAYHRTPLWMVRGRLVPPKLRCNLIADGGWPSDLEWRLEQVIENDDSPGLAYIREDFDWNAAKKRVEKVLAEFGEKLPVFEPMTNAPLVAGETPDCTSARFRIKLRRFEFLTAGNPEQKKHELIGLIQTTEAEAKSKILGYLSHGEMMLVLPGIARDPLDPQNRIICAPHVLTDGAWAWTADVEYFVERYNIRLPEDFIENMRKNDWRIPSDINLKLLEL